MKPIVGIMGPGETGQKTLNTAYKTGKMIAQNGWLLLTGGRNAGVMEAANKGAKEAEGITLGILPDENKSRKSEFVDIPVVTGMGNARNNINVLTSDVVIACGLGAGTVSEISLALKNNKKVILMEINEEEQKFFTGLGKQQILIADSPEKAIDFVKNSLK